MKHNLIDLLDDSPPNLSAALDLARRQFAVFPITLKPNGEWTPILGWQAKATDDPDQIRRWWRDTPNARVGLPTGCRNGITVLDIDRKHGKDGFAALRAMGIEADDLSPVMVRTPSGGAHVVFAYREGLKNSVGKIGSGLDVRNDGGFIVAPGSFRDGKRYEAIGAPLGSVTLPPFPEALKPAAAPEREPAAILATASDEQRAWAVTHLQMLADDLAVMRDGDGRNSALNAAAMWTGGAAAQGGMLDRDDVHDVLWAACSRNGLPRREFEATFKSGWSAGLRKPISDFPRGISAYDFDDLPPLEGGEPAEDWRTKLDRDSEKRLKKTAHNVAVIVRNASTTAGIFALDEFRHRVTITKRPGAELVGEHWEPGLLRDINETAVKTWLSAPRRLGGWGLEASKENVESAIRLAAYERRFHPVRDRLASYVHDGRPRAESLFIEYLGCADTPYYRETARLLLLGAVTRVFEPGHKFDYMPIIEGAQGVRKSTFVKALGLGWAGDPMINWSGGKEILEQTEGFWLIEIPELSSMSRAESNEIKANLTRTTDTARLSYGHNPETRPRQCIFIGTTNDREYLKDPTGNRRFWPIPCTVSTIDTDRLGSEAPQIWAEAVAWYRAMREAQPHGDLFLSFRSGSAAEREAMALQSSRKADTAEDVLAGQIGAWLEQPIGDNIGFDDLDPDAPKTFRTVTCTAQIWTEMIGARPPIPHHEAMKIGKALQLIGWGKSGTKTTHPELRRYGKVSVYARDGNGA